MDGNTFSDDEWSKVATAEVEEDGRYRRVSIYVHDKNGGYCIYFGADEYEGIGQSCGTYSYYDGKLRDADGDDIVTRNIKDLDDDYVQAEAITASDQSDDNDDVDYVLPGRGHRGGRGRGRGPRGGRRRGRGRGRGARGRRGGGRGRGARGRRGGGRGRGARGRRGGRGTTGWTRPVLTARQFECSECYIRSDCNPVVQDQHDRHLPWCAKYKKGKSCVMPSDVDVKVSQEEVQYYLVKKLKTRLRMYGASTAGKKSELVRRLQLSMESPPPDLDVGSWYHYNKKETASRLEKFCQTNHIMVPSGYVRSRVHSQSITHSLAR